jgi:hypothetical protein
MEKIVQNQIQIHIKNDKSINYVGIKKLFFLYYYFYVDFEENETDCLCKIVI